ncbi:hypothetical protein [Nonomuraea sp. NPDC050691]|uniref:hypothetical protein n=1 Tax=Nonomuraea sp. NPDC050691 TaxID=3155661 RepID=UPI0033FFE0CF
MRHPIYPSPQAAMAVERRYGELLARWAAPCEPGLSAPSRPPPGSGYAAWLDDVLLDSHDIRDRLARTVPHADVRFLPEAGHVPRHTDEIMDFLEAAHA